MRATAWTASIVCLAVVRLASGASGGEAEVGLAAPATPGCLACRAELASLQSQLSQEEWGRVQQGEVVVSKSVEQGTDGGRKSWAVSTALFPYPVAQVWNLLVDFEARPRFAPNMKSAKIVRRQGGRVWVDQTVSVLMTDIDFRIINTVEPEHGRVTWCLDPEAKNEIAATSGSWQLVAVGEAETVLQYQSRIETGRPVPEFVEDFLAASSLPKVLAGVRSELARRYPLGAEAPSTR